MYADSRMAPENSWGRDPKNSTAAEGCFAMNGVCTALVGVIIDRPCMDSLTNLKFRINPLILKIRKRIRITLVLRQRERRRTNDGESVDDFIQNKMRKVPRKW